MPIDPKKCCGTHSKKKEESGECCQLDKKNDAEQATYEYAINVKPATKEKHE